MSYDVILAEGRAMHAHPSIEPARTALLVIDMQNAFALPSSPFGKEAVRALVEPINALAGTVRGAGGHVVWTRHAYTDEGPQAMQPWQVDGPVFAMLAERLRPGLPDYQLVDEMDVHGADDVIDKYRYSALGRHSSGLEDILVQRGITTVIVVGCASNTCCESTARDAYALGYRVFAPEDGNACASEAERRSAILNMSRVCADIRPIADLTALIAAAA